MTRAATNDEKRIRMKRFVDLAIKLALTDRQKQIIEMYYIENKKMPEIAQSLGINKSTVLRTLRTAEQKLKKFKIIFEKVAY